MSTVSAEAVRPVLAEQTAAINDGETGRTDSSSEEKEEEEKEDDRIFTATHTLNHDHD